MRNSDYFFIRKVYTIIAVMLLEMLFFVAILRNDKFAIQVQPSRSGVCVVGQSDTSAVALKKYCSGGEVECPNGQSDCPGDQTCDTYLDPNCGKLAWLYYFSLVVGLLSYYMLLCCIKNARTYPINYVLLGVFSTCWGFMIGVVTSIYSTSAVTMALATTAGIVVGLTFFACQTKYDFTGMGGYLFAALWAMIIFSILASFFRCYSCDEADVNMWHTINTVYSAIGVVLFSMFLVYDTQLMMGGSHKQSFGIDDYVFAAIMIYLDIINIFLYLLALFGDR